MAEGRPFWPAPEAPPALTAEEVHVWRVDLDAGSDAAAPLRRVLSPDEAERAERFHFARDRISFTVARGALRFILGRYTGRQPAGLRFRYGPQGKPELAGGAAGGDAPSFNVSHSGSLALIAVTTERKIGVDVEYMRPLNGGDRIPERFFSPGEVERLHALPAEQQLQGFFACWTRKEAYIKARGGGLSLPLDQFEVSLEPAAPARLLDVRWDPDETSRWRLEALHPAEGYAAAVVAEGFDWALKRWQWQVD